jgi:hypothetical protein
MPSQPPTHDSSPHELAIGLTVRMPDRASVAPAPPVRPSGNKQPQDTIAGCRLLAEGDLTRARDTDTDEGRRKFEHSAATWTRRGDMLEDLAGRRDRKSATKDSDPTPPRG